MMRPQRLGQIVIPDDELAQDKKHAEDLAHAEWDGRQST